ncbi:helix-turn-helix domain-containing protein [Mesorhizobium temperatum]|uniref:helix-turn-helix domain-containing protein n=1 Tax=Mesorhizobium temperatum TaxID=241416 RepID=UPI001FD9E315|nr:helix-turn-helix domain-containing protein [Mesorhizobium temperatum]
MFYLPYLVTNTNLVGFLTICPMADCRQQEFVYYNKIAAYGDKMAITGNQIRAARSLVGMEQIALADKAGVSANTIRNMEAFGAERVKVRTGTLDAVTDALRGAGVIFLDDGDTANGGPGVRLRTKP